LSRSQSCWGRRGGGKARSNRRPYSLYRLAEDPGRKKKRRRRVCEKGRHASLRRRREKKKHGGGEKRAIIVSDSELPAFSPEQPGKEDRIRMPVQMQHLSSAITGKRGGKKGVDAPAWRPTSLGPSMSSKKRKKKENKER